MRTTISPTNHKAKLALKYSGLKCEYTSLLKKKEIIKEQMASFTICKGSRIYHISLKTKIALMVGVLWHVNSDRKNTWKFIKKTYSFPKNVSAIWGLMNVWQNANPLHCKYCFGR